MLDTIVAYICIYIKHVFSKSLPLEVHFCDIRRVGKTKAPGNALGLSRSDVYCFRCDRLILFVVLFVFEVFVVIIFLIIICFFIVVVDFMLFDGKLNSSVDHTSFYGSAKRPRFR